LFELENSDHVRSCKQKKRTFWKKQLIFYFLY